MVSLYSFMAGKEYHMVLILPILLPHKVIQRLGIIPINFSHKLDVESQPALEIDPQVILLHII